MTAGFLAFFFVREKRHVTCLLGCLLFLHAADILFYRFDQMGQRLIVPKAVLGPALSYRDVVYKPRRETDQACFKRWGFDRVPILNRTQTYSTFAFVSSCDTVTIERLNYLQVGYADYLEAFFGNQGGGKDCLLYLSSLREMTSDEKKMPETFKKVSGFSADKIRFFDKALFAGSLEREKRLISSVAFHGDGLLLQDGGDSSLPDEGELDWLAKDHHLDIAYQVEEFTPNGIRIRLGTPTQKPLWLFYSDAWHARWKAYVDGKSVDVRKGNIAYKAVYLEKGSREVSFRFEDPWLVFLIRLAGVVSLGILVIVVTLARKELVKAPFGISSN
jgi:hypothetical protein